MGWPRGIQVNTELGRWSGGHLVSFPRSLRWDPGRGVGEVRRTSPPTLLWSTFRTEKLAAIFF